LYRCRDKAQIFHTPFYKLPWEKRLRLFLRKNSRNRFFPGEFVEGGMKNVRFISATVQDRVMVTMLDE